MLAAMGLAEHVRGLCGVEWPGRSGPLMKDVRVGRGDETEPREDNRKVLGAV